MKKDNGNASPNIPERPWLPAVRWAQVAILALFVVVSFWLLAVDSANYLRKIELLSYFAPTAMYLGECLNTPGGLLVYASTFLTQTFYYPWLGAAVYILLMLLMALVSVRALRLSPSLRPLALVLPALSILALLSVGYAIFSLKSPGFAYTLPLGLTVAMSALWLYRSVSNVVARLLLMLVIVTGGYCAMGFYGLLAGAMCAAFELTSVLTRGATALRRVLSVVLAAIGGAAIWLVPHLWFDYIGGDLMIVRMYICPLPRFIEGEGSLWIPYNIIIAGAVAMAALTALPRREALDRLTVTAGATLAAVGAMVCAVVLPLRDANLRLTLDLDHAMQQGDWQGAITRAQAAHDIEPTRVNVVLTDLALLRAGGMGDHMFRFPIASAPYMTPRNMRATHDIISRMISYHTGMVNFAYRWGMEYKVEYGTSVEQLQFMAKAALLNGDLALARKALDNLRLTAFHSSWADRYYKYVEQPGLMAEDPELGAIMRLRTLYPGFIMDNGQLEGYIWKYLAYNDNGTPESLELALNSSLICQDMMAFGGKLPRYARTAQRLPVHIQEAILAWQTIDDNFDISPYQIDSAVRERFAAFMKAQQMYAQLAPDQQKEMLRTMYGDTFWYYYLYCDKLTIF